MRYLLVFALFMYGCAPTPTVKASNENTVVIKGATNQTLDGALALADSECSKYGKKARYIPDAVLDGMASFDCL